MSLVAALAAFGLAIGLLTVTPGLDTMLVLRTAASEGRRPAFAAMVGIQLGCLAWGAAVALGLGVLLAASAAAYTALVWCGAAYVAWVGLTLLLHPRRRIETGAPGPGGGGAMRGLRRGVLTNLLNPKVGVFYISFLPQFVPAGWPAGPFVFALAVAHVALVSAWLSLLILGTDRLGRWLRRPRVVAWLDRVTGLVFIAFSARLVASRA